MTRKLRCCCDEKVSEGLPRCVEKDSEVLGVVGGSCVSMRTVGSLFADRWGLVPDWLLLLACCAPSLHWSLVCVYWFVYSFCFIL